MTITVEHPEVPLARDATHDRVGISGAATCAYEARAYIYVTVKQHGVSEGPIQDEVLCPLDSAAPWASLISAPRKTFHPGRATIEVTGALCAESPTEPWNIPTDPFCSVITIEQQVRSKLQQ